ncbi:hypothetical protein J0H33_14770 [bacterium]|nr:hypothetical protein [bacterium]
MVSHVSHWEERFTSPETCPGAIRRYIDHGWQVSQVRGPRHGPFVVLFRMDERP